MKPSKRIVNLKLTGQTHTFSQILNAEHSTCGVLGPIAKNMGMITFIFVTESSNEKISSGSVQLI